MQRHEALTIHITAWQEGEYKQDEFPAMAIFRLQAIVSLPKLAIFSDDALFHASPCW